ncbi:MAG: type II toxin-antitoxin system HicB family antitoxin [Planctomycetaceae bacterium]|nr:type II toxin-antitoxin system HicB family antitoxin [Planctomycetaceae bacterium]
MEVMTYRGYTATVEYDDADGILFGRVMGIRDIIDFEGDSVVDLEEDFHVAIDSYIQACEEIGKTPETPSLGM